MSIANFKRVLGLKEVVTLVLGAVIGWSWVILSGDIVLKAGSVGSLVAFAISALLFTLIGLTYAELTSSLPFAGGEHVYSLRALGRNASFVCTWSVVLAYVSVVVFEAVALPVAIEYFFPNFKIGYLWTIAGYEVYFSYVLLGIIVSIGLTAMNILGIKMAASFQTFTTFFILLVGLFLIIGAFSNGSSANLEPPIANGTSGIFSVLIMIPFMLVGFDVVPQAAEEIDLPFRQIGRLIVLTILIAIIWYSLIIFSMAYVLPRASIIPNSLSVADAANKAWGTPLAGQLLIAAGVAGILTSWNSFLIGGSRAIYAMAKDGMLPRAFSRIHQQYRTPVLALLLIGMLSIIGPFLGRQALLYFVNAGSFALMIAYFFVALSFLVLRRKEPALHRPFKVKYGQWVGYTTMLLTLLLGLLFLPGSPSALKTQEWWIVLGWFAFGLLLLILTNKNSK